MDNKKYYIRSINVGKSPNYLTVNLPTSLAKKLSISKNHYVKISEQEKKIIIEKIMIWKDLYATSLFSDEGEKGFNYIIGNIQKDIVTINGTTTIQFLRTGTYSILRGTMISLITNKPFCIHQGTLLESEHIKDIIFRNHL